MTTGSQDRATLLQDAETKKRYNAQHFSISAPRYDLATRGMSLGRDGAWKRALIAALPENLEAPNCLDLACGTGDVCFLLRKKYPDARITGVDLTDGMLQIARRRDRSKEICFLAADMNATGLPDASFDLITGSYALRNAPDLPKALSEIARLLKPGGTAAFLDFAKPESPALQGLQYRLLHFWCGLWGGILHGDTRIHSYIADSLKGYPDSKRLRGMFEEVGMRVVLRRGFYFGVVEMVVVRKVW